MYINNSIKFDINLKLFDMSIKKLKFTRFSKVNDTLILMYHIDTSTDIRLMTIFIVMFYIIISFNLTFNFKIHLSDKELSNMPYIKFNIWVIYSLFFKNKCHILKINIIK